MKPTHIIFRIDEGDEEPFFVEIALDENDYPEQTGRTFSVHEGDSYLTMKRTQVVLAHKESPDDPGSRDLMWATIFDDDDNECSPHTMPFGNLMHCVKYMVQEQRKDIN
jgi:hypothetical protein